MTSTRRLHRVGWHGQRRESKRTKSSVLIIASDLAHGRLRLVPRLRCPWHQTWILSRERVTGKARPCRCAVDGSGADKDAKSAMEAYIDALIDRAQTLLDEQFRNIREQALSTILADIKDDLAGFGNAV